MKQKRNKKGFTLVEMIVSIGIFAIISVAVAQAFTSGFFAFQQSRQIQRNLETAQFAMNTLAKELRTSTVVDMSGSLGSGMYTSIRFYDYSQDRCFEYRFDQIDSKHPLKAKWANKTDVDSGSGDIADNCNAYSFLNGSETVLTTGYISDGKFFVVQSNGTASPKKIGRVVVTMTIKQNSDANAKGVTVQSGVSLRDYSYVGI